MTYDLNRAIQIAITDAMKDLRREGETDTSNPHVQQIISEHAESAVPVYYAELLDVYTHNHTRLMDYADFEFTFDQKRSNSDPFINWDGIMQAVYYLAYDRITEAVDAMEVTA